MKKNFEDLYDILSEGNSRFLCSINKDKHLKDEKIKSIIKSSVLLRSEVNDLRQVKNISKYRRKNEDMIDFQASVSEFYFSYFLNKHYRKDFFNNIKNFTVSTPEVASLFINHQSEDFKIINNKKNQVLNFDVKSQFSFNNRLNINIKSHKRAKSHNCKFYIVCIINSKNKSDFENIESIDFYMLSVNDFENNSVEVDNQKGTPFLSYDLKLLKK